jgi:hypothetical protein
MSNPTSVKQDGYLIRLSLSGGRHTILFAEDGKPFPNKREAARRHSQIVKEWRWGQHAYLLPYTNARTGFSAHNNSATRSAELRFRASTVGRIEVLPNYVEVPA